VIVIEQFLRPSQALIGLGRQSKNTRNFQAEVFFASFFFKRKKALVFFDCRIGSEGERNL